MKSLLISILLACLVFSATETPACTGIYASDGKMTLAGNNEDFWLCNTKMWFVPGDGEERFGRVYFGFEDMYPQGGMNEKGLFFDGFATQRCEVKNSLDKPKYKGQITDDVMASCATVDEVIEFLSRYNLQILENAMFMFGDSHGDSVIIEGDEFLRKQGRFQVVTNFYQSRTNPEDVSCRRFKIATRLFAESPEISVDLFRRVLAAVHVELTSPTQYSNIYDLENKVVYLYHFHNFENVVKIDLAAELAKGAHTCDLPALFPNTFASKHFEKWRENEMQKQRAERRDSSIDPATYNDYIGAYIVTKGVYKGMSFSLTLEQNKLFVRITGGESFELIPEGQDRFFQIGNHGSQDFSFTRDVEGKITHATYEFFMRKIEAKRISTGSE